jgi:hypothetical protein
MRGMERERKGWGEGRKREKKWRNLTSKICFWPIHSIEPYLNTNPICYSLLYSTAKQRYSR